MQIQTILNRIQKHRGFVYGPVRLRDEGGSLRLEVEIYPHGGAGHGVLAAAAAARSTTPSARAGSSSSPCGASACSSST